MQKQGYNRNVLDTEKVGGLLVKLAMPSFFGMFVQALYNVVNTIFIGHSVGTLAIAGLSIVFPLQMLFMGIAMMVGIGGTSVISRSLGSGDTLQAERTLGNGMTSIIVLSLVGTAAILPNVDFLLRLIGASEEVLPYAREYLIIIVIGMLFNLTGMALLNFARAEGNTRVGMISQIVGAILNIILDAIFIVYLGWGVKGAALGTVIAQITALVIMSSYYLSGSSYLKIRARNLRPDFKIIKSIFTIGISGFVQTVAGSLSSVLLIREVVFYGGDVYLSAFGIVQRVMMFASMPAMVIGQGVQPILGFNYGAKRYSLALKALKIAAIASTTMSALACIVLYALPNPIMRIFTTDPELIAAGVRTSRLIFIGMPMMGFLMVGSSSFQSIGKAMQAFITALARPVLFLIPAVMILPHLIQLPGVFLSFPVSDVFSLILTIVMLVPVIKEFRRAAAAEKLAKPETVIPSQLLESTEGKS